MDKDKSKQVETFEEMDDDFLLQFANDVPQVSPSELLEHRFKKKLQENEDLKKKKKPSRGLVWKTWAVAASILLIVSLFNRNSDIINPPAVNQQDSFQLVRTLVGTQHAPKAKAWIIEEKVLQKKMFFVSGLETLPPTQQYQLWLIKDGKRISGAIFDISQAEQTVVINSIIPLKSFQGFGVTIEPHGGSPGPTGLKVL